MSALGEAFVRIRPNTAGFKAEAEGPVASAGRDLGKVFATAFAIGGVAETIKSVVEAATKQNSAFALLDQTLKDAGQSTEGFSASLHDKLEVAARRTGISAEDLAQGMVRIVSATHDTGKALADLNIAENLSRQRHIDLSVAALAVAKAETGSFTSLQRYIGLIPKVTASVDALKAKYLLVAEASGKLDASGKAAYAAALKGAEAADKAATAQNALALAQKESAGAATAFAGTYEGQFERLHVAVDQLKVAVGTELVGGLAHGAEGVDAFIGKLLESNKVQDEARQAARDIGAALHDVKDIVVTVGPPLVSLTDDLGGFVRVGELAAALFVGNKILGGLAGIGAKEAVVAGGAATAAASMEALTLAINANTFALTGNADALTVVAGREALVGTTAEGAAAKVGLLSGSVSLLKRALVEYLIVNQAIKALPGQHDLGLDFSNSVARDVTGSNKSPYAKGTTLDLLYQAGKAGQKGPVLTLAPGDTEQLKGLAKAEVKAYQAGLADATGGGVPTESLYDQLIKDGLANAAKKAKEKATHNKDLIQAGSAAIKSLREGITSDQTDLAQLKVDMADAVTQGAEAVDQAVQQAKQNLTTIGQSLATSIGTFIDKPLNDEAQRLSDTQDRITARFDRLTAALQGKQQALSREQSKISAATDAKSLKQLGESVLLPGGRKLDADPQKALAQLEALQKVTKSPALDDFVLRYRTSSLQVQQDTLGLKASAIDARRQAAETGLGLTGDALKLKQDQAAHSKQQAITQIANLTDLLAQGQISQPAFDKALGGVLKRNHLTFIAAAKADGIAFADTFAAQLKGLGLQEGALKAGPQRAGSGLGPSITRPLDTLNQTAKTVAGIAKQQRDKQLDETKKTNQLLAKLAGNAKAQAFINSLEKNPGSASKRLKALAGVPG